jgi:hypothetical protein
MPQSISYIISPYRKLKELKTYQRPEIYFFTVTFPSDNFRREIFRCTTECECYLIFCLPDFGETEISQLYMPFGVEEDVFRLEVPVDDAVLMQALEGQQNLCGIKSSSVFREPLFSPEVIEELAAVQKVNDEIQLLRGLESVMQSDDEGMPNLLQN